MDKKPYHSLLPGYLQDVLRAAVKKNDDAQRFTDIVYMSELERSIQRVKNAYPQAFKRMVYEGRY